MCQEGVMGESWVSVSRMYEGGVMGVSKGCHGHVVGV